MVEKCAAMELSAGNHVVYVEGFQAGGGVGMEALYSGPDTNGKKVYIRSGSPTKPGQYYGDCDPTQQLKDPLSFTICVFRSSVGMSTIPAIGQANTGFNRLYYVGTGQIPTVNLNSLDDFRKAVQYTPPSNYAWAIFGQLVIGITGKYTLCITSDDG